VLDRAPISLPDWEEPETAALGGSKRVPERRTQSAECRAQSLGFVLNVEVDGV